MEFWRIDEYDGEMTAMGYTDAEVAEAKNLLDLSRGKSISSVANGAQPDTLNVPARALLCLMIGGTEAKGERR